MNIREALHKGLEGMVLPEEDKGEEDSGIIKTIQSRGKKKEYFEGAASISEASTKTFFLFDNSYPNVQIQVHDKKPCSFIIPGVASGSYASSQRAALIKELLKDFGNAESCFIKGARTVRLALVAGEIMDNSIYSGRIMIDDKEKYEFYVNYEKIISKSSLKKL